MAHIPANERREALIEAALRVVARDGIAGATTRAIVAEADMPLASFHYVFDSHDELMAELVQRAVNEEYRAIAPLLGSDITDASLGDLVEAGLTRYLDSVKAEPERERAMLELTQYALRDERTAHLARLQYERYTELVQMALEAAAGRTGWRWNVPVVEVARMVVALADGITISWLVRHDDGEALALARSGARAVEAHASAPERSA
ncbi:TetR/AcrR family transcriptional regulator [Gryllotalpicola protaetiae]|uniref:TetR/AcrR family transcriptional regulator n=1 Tax=Gryllotalpicola protaetiae TaxID=2419771 RepID=UPI0013C5200C|nr:TetR family transcriptional regulator C-terminal domain-containing protein [Gryllotalpicola protaetiae]